MIGGPKTVSQIELHLYASNCATDNGQFQFIQNNNPGIPLVNGTYSFSNASGNTLQSTMCQESPPANSFKLVAYNNNSVSTGCFHFTCNGANTLITCTQTATLDLSGLN